MDYSAANTALCNPVFQVGVIAGLILISNILRRKVPFITRSLMPISVLAELWLPYLIMAILGGVVTSCICASCARGCISATPRRASSRCTAC